MKWFPILVIAVLSIVMVRSDLAQTKSPSNSSDATVQTKRDKKTEKAKVKTAKPTSKAPSGDKGKNTTSTQDAAYAAAYKSGSVKP